ncbi:lipopolysaccharide core biosynthesis glycosyl transferase [Sphingomonas sp. LH128]|uniref:glycosyltransferase family 2 protein n=1 Tax=Sphingomonas sp. LH128 TaxID=473781 RepID=UPI00027CAAA1|nr:glycosyltransferase family 2 protein [Sphingomonas sp. LH128]EJU14590.1 lipopolysaccharide core biosynthesis glycosyl transferase [Sphingomonas sp. LH128]
MTTVAVVILTFNEERHIARALESISSFATQIFIVDSFSTDATVSIAMRHGAKVVSRDFVNYADQFQWGLENLPINAEWTMRLDADEVIDPALAAEINQKLPELTVDAEIGGINFKRRHIFMGRWVRHGGRYPLILTRLWRSGKGRIEDRWMDEHIVVNSGKIVMLENYFSDINLNDLTFFTDKHNKYAVREAIDALNERYNLFPGEFTVTSESASFQASFKRFIKEKIYNNLPFWMGPLLYFVWRYIFQLGFLDGRSGLIYHFLQGFWYRFLVGAKIYEFDRHLRPLVSAAERLTMLEKLTGKNLAPRTRSIEKPAIRL